MLYMAKCDRTYCARRHPPRGFFVAAASLSIFRKKPAPDLIVSAFTRVFRRAMGGNRFSVRKCDQCKKLRPDRLRARRSRTS